MAVSYPTARCAICGAAFPKTKSIRLYCSKYCYKRAGYLAKRGPIKARGCAECGAPLPTPTRKGDRSDHVYCSTRCTRVADYRRNRTVINARNNTRHASTHPRRHATCKGCAVRFLAKRVDSKFCSGVCFWKWFSHTPSRVVAQRAQASKRGALKRGASLVERIDARVVFARDGWRCQLCGADTARAELGKRHPRAPTMDHIIPLALGGEHSYRNIQCACLRCNLRKGARIQGQARLF